MFRVQRQPSLRGAPDGAGSPPRTAGVKRPQVFDSSPTPLVAVETRLGSPRAAGPGPGLGGSGGRCTAALSEAAGEVG